MVLLAVGRRGGRGLWILGSSTPDPSHQPHGCPKTWAAVVADVGGPGRDDGLLPGLAAEPDRRRSSTASGTRPGCPSTQWQLGYAWLEQGQLVHVVFEGYPPGHVPARLRGGAVLRRREPDDRDRSRGHVVHVVRPQPRLAHRAHRRRSSTPAATSTSSRSTSPRPVSTQADRQARPAPHHRSSSSASNRVQPGTVLDRDARLLARRRARPRHRVGHVRPAALAADRGARAAPRERRARSGTSAPRLRNGPIAAAARVARRPPRDPRRARAAAPRRRTSTRSRRSAPPAAAAITQSTPVVARVVGRRARGGRHHARGHRRRPRRRVRPRLRARPARPATTPSPTAGRRLLPVLERRAVRPSWRAGAASSGSPSSTGTCTTETAPRRASGTGPTCSPSRCTCGTARGARPIPRPARPTRSAPATARAAT